MSDMAEMFNEWGEAKAQKRTENRTRGAEILAHNAIQFQSNNDGAHLIVTTGKGVVDFWPGTGMWIVRGQPTKRRGVLKLVRFAKLKGGA